jgi:hypothetical protein
LTIRHGFSEFDLLQIDCEGFDGEVLKSFHRPALIQFEHAHMLRGDLKGTSKNY